MNSYVLSKVLSVFVAVASQILLKKSANKHYDSKIKEYLNFEVIFAYGMFFISMLMSVYGLKGMSISYSSIIESLSYILIPITGYVFFKEKITQKQYIGILIIMAGIVVYSL